MEESLLWIIDYYFGQNLCFKVKISLIDGFFFTNTAFLTCGLL